MNLTTTLKDSVKEDILLSLRWRRVLLKFSLLQLLGAAVSLAFCPQFGLGPGGHGITHWLRILGDWACALFCGSLFLSSGMVLAIFGMGPGELRWIWKRCSVALLILPGLLWGGLMLFNVSLGLEPEGLQYHAAWIFAGIVAEALWVRGRIGFISQNL